MSSSLLQSVFKIHGIGQSTQDTELTAGLQIQTGAEAGRVKAGKGLLKDGLKVYNKKCVLARKFHRDNTFIGFGDTRLIVPGEVEKYRSAMLSRIEEINNEAELFISEYDSHKERDKQVLSSAYDEEDYPSVEKLKELFYVEFSIQPMGEPSQFLKMAVAGENGQKLKEDYEKALKKVTESVRNQVLGTLLSLISEVSEVLTTGGKLIDTENKKGPVAKLREYLERIPSLNVDGDPVIAGLYAECKGKLELTTDILKTSDFHKNNTETAATEIVKRFGIGPKLRKIEVPEEKAPESEEAPMNPETEAALP